MPVVGNSNAQLGECCASDKSTVENSQTTVSVNMFQQENLFTSGPLQPTVPAASMTQADFRNHETSLFDNVDFSMKVDAVVTSKLNENENLSNSLFEPFFVAQLPAVAPASTAVLSLADDDFFAVKTVAVNNKSRKYLFVDDPSSTALNLPAETRLNEPREFTFYPATGSTSEKDKKDCFSLFDTAQPVIAERRTFTFDTMVTFAEKEEAGNMPGGSTDCVPFEDNAVSPKVTDQPLTFLFVPVDRNESANIDLFQ